MQTKWFGVYGIRKFYKQWLNLEDQNSTEWRSSPDDPKGKPKNAKELLFVLYVYILFVWNDICFFPVLTYANI